VAKRFCLALALILLGYVSYVLLGLPPRAAVSSLGRTNPARTGVMRQREEEARSRKRKPAHSQVFVPLERISRALIEAVLVAEDPKFFGHDGVDWEALQESVETDIQKRTYVRGGSTITQQLAKNLFFTTRKSLTRKIRELIVARWLEKDLAKRRILELYLNVIEWGDGVYGCEAAAQRYYGKSASELTTEEAAGLAAMIPSPRRINPLTNPKQFALAQRRVLSLMERSGYIKGAGGLGTPPSKPAVDPEEAAPP
jgi:monofunctional biosynthetic peptidoglycan transglycosylase